MEEQDRTISKYDRLYGSSKMVGMSTRASTIQNVESVTGRAETFIVQTFRHEDGDRIFLQCVDENSNVTRLALPAKVCNAIASQRDSLTKKRRSIAGRVQAKIRMERGEKPGFLREPRRLQ
jgi:hypothetical protein